MALASLVIGRLRDVRERYRRLRYSSMVSSSSCFRAEAIRWELNSLNFMSLHYVKNPIPTLFPFQEQFSATKQQPSSFAFASCRSSPCSAHGKSCARYVLPDQTASAGTSTMNSNSRTCSSRYFKSSFSRTFSSSCLR